MASMRSGSGDHWFALFTEDGAVLHGLAADAPMYRKDDPWDGIWDSLPSAFADFRTEPAFDTKNSTFLIWRLDSDRAWSRGEIEFPEDHADPDGSTALLSILDGNPETYVAQAYERYEVELPIEAVKAIYDHSPLTEELVGAFDSDVALEDLEKDLAEIGYTEGAAE